MVVRIAGKRMYLWRAVDHEGEVLDMLVQRRRDKRAALRLMRKLLRKQGFAPKLLTTGRLPKSGADLCSQPTSAGWKTPAFAGALKRMIAAMLEVFCDSVKEVPRRIVLDIDDTEDRVHGGQQLALFNAYYDSRCFQPIHIYEATTGKPVVIIEAFPLHDSRKLLSATAARYPRSWRICPAQRSRVAKISSLLSDINVTLTASTPISRKRRSLSKSSGAPPSRNDSDLGSRPASLAMARNFGT
jgi:hypothetical protein